MEGLFPDTKAVDVGIGDFHPRLEFRARLLCEDLESFAIRGAGDQLDDEID